MTPVEFREARKSMGLTQGQTASMLGYGSQSRVSEIERGIERPSSTVIRLLRAYVDGYRPGDWPQSKAPRTPSAQSTSP